jgi:hypothetical protein
MVMRSLCRHMNGRRTRAIRTSIMSVFPMLTKSVCSFVTKQVTWTLSGAPDTSRRRPNPSRHKDPQVQLVGLKLCVGPKIIALINLRPTGSRSRTRRGVLLRREYTVLSTHFCPIPGVPVPSPGTTKLLQKAPFQLVPQLTF